MAMIDVWRRLAGRISPTRPIVEQRHRGQGRRGVVTALAPPGGYQAIDAVTPDDLAQIVFDLHAGRPDRYLGLAETMETEAHYAAALQQRKRAVSRLGAIVEPASDSAGDKKAADDLRAHVVDQPEFAPLVYDCLDAVGKGYAVVEIEWDTSPPGPWRPAAYHWRDPRWFRADADDNLLVRRGPGDYRPLPAMRTIVHRAHTRSGPTARNGVALPSAYYYCVKKFDFSAWTSFIEVFGYPLRLGRYPRAATEKDIEILLTAIANIGRDIGAALPESMRIEIMEGIKPGGSIEHFERLARMANEEVSKLVLGQTASTEKEPGKLGNDDAQENVRQDLTEADAMQLGATLTRDLARPFHALNSPAGTGCPRIRIPVPRAEDIVALVESVAKLIPFGFRVGQAVMSARLGLPVPAEGEPALQPRGAAPGEPDPHAEDPPAEGLDVAAELELLAEHERWEPLNGPRLQAIRTLVADSESLDEVRERLPELLAMDVEQLQERLAAATLKARGLGDIDWRATE